MGPDLDPRSRGAYHQMKLQELLEGDESAVAQWLTAKNLLHECNCSYTVYDVDAVSAAVQEEFGDEQCDEIDLWASDLANHFGWLWMESSEPKYDIYHCQHCAGTEFARFMDLMRKSEVMAEDTAASPPEEPTPGPAVSEPFVVYVDESYTNGFPREAGGSLAFGAFIIPESAIEAVQQGVAEIIKANYRGSAPDELKHSAISKHPGLLERVGRGVAELINRIPSSAVIAIYVPRSGLFGEKRRVMQAIGHYRKDPPKADDLDNVESPEAVEAAVGEAVDGIAQTISTCVGGFLGSRNLSGRIIFDPRSKKRDERLLKALEEHLPNTPLNPVLLPEGNCVVTLTAGQEMERLGDRVKVEATTDSRQVPGLQVADFIAGDIRTFFDEIPELLTEAITDDPLVNKGILFHQLFRRSELSTATKEKLKKPGKSAVLRYRDRLANGIVSCFANNGQMRNVNLVHGHLFDVMD